MLEPNVIPGPDAINVAQAIFNVLLSITANGFLRRIADFHKRDPRTLTIGELHRLLGRRWPDALSLLNRDAITNPPAYIASRVSPANWSSIISLIPDLDRIDSSGNGEMQGAVSSVRKSLLAQRILENPVLIRDLRGYFFKATLLTQGFYRRSLHSLPVQSTNNGIQNWLFNGFDHWGPSWDISIDPKDQNSMKGEPVADYVLGQIGSEDELESLPILIHRTKMEPIHNHYASSKYEGTHALHVNIKKGYVIHKDHLANLIGDLQVQPYIERLLKWGKSFDYLIVVDKAPISHKIEPIENDGTQMPPLYSAYLWQCLRPKNILFPDPSQVYYIWQHADLTRRDAYEFKLEILHKERKSLEGRFGPMRLIQQSSPFVKLPKQNEPEMTAEQFGRYILMLP